jgi:hypothetical protein
MCKKKKRTVSNRAAVGSSKLVLARSTTASAHEDDQVDSCDCEFPESDSTPDQELPPARGGNPALNLIIVSFLLERLSTQKKATFWWP